MCLLVVCVFSCKKDDPVEECQQRIVEDWERFVGEYMVYDTLDNYLYDMRISHFYSDAEGNGVGTDSIFIENFAGKFDIRYAFRYKTDPDLFSIGIINPLKDQEDNSWFLSSLSDDPETDIRENKLINDTIILSFLMDNTAYYINEGRLYFSCECKHVAVKQD